MHLPRLGYGNFSGLKMSDYAASLVILGFT